MGIVCIHRRAILAACWGAYARGRSVIGIGNMRDVGWRGQRRCRLVSGRLAVILRGAWKISEPGELELEVDAVEVLKALVASCN